MAAEHEGPSEADPAGPGEPPPGPDVPGSEAFWARIVAEREVLADDLAALSVDAWDTPSWCANWSVREVLAHLTSGLRMTPRRFVGSLLRARLNPDRMIDQGLRPYLGPWPDDTLRQFREALRVRSAPPGLKLAPLGEIVVHGEDIRRPLGLTREYPADAVRQLLDFYTGANLPVGGRRRVDGLHLLASDSDYSHGAGGRVEGPMISLLLAATGRAGACADLAGPGVPILRGRCG